MYHIEDWTGRILFDGKTFHSFQEGWSYIYKSDPMPEGEPENYYDDYYVVPVSE